MASAQNSGQNDTIIFTLKRHKLVRSLCTSSAMETLRGSSVSADATPGIFSSSHRRVYRVMPGADRQIRLRAADFAGVFSTSRLYAKSLYAIKSGWWISSPFVEHLGKHLQMNIDRPVLRDRSMVQSLTEIQER